jgi:hypothetical protein
MSEYKEVYRYKGNINCSGNNLTKQVTYAIKKCLYNLCNSFFWVGYCLFPHMYSVKNTLT